MALREEVPGRCGATTLDTFVGAHGQEGVGKYSL